MLSFACLPLTGTRSTSVIDIKGKNLPEEDEEEEVVDFFREERVTDVIPKLKSLNEYGLVKETIKVEEEEEENDGIDPLGAIKYDFLLHSLFCFKTCCRGPGSHVDAP